MKYVIMLLYLRGRSRKQGGQLEALFLDENIDASKEVDGGKSTRF